MKVSPDWNDFETWSNEMIDIFHPRISAYVSIILFVCVSHAKIYDLTILGDSISSGYGVKPEDSWTKIMMNNLSCPIKVKNLSIQGATSNDGITTLTNFYAQHKTDYLIIELGGNDALRGLSLISLYKNLNKLVELAQENQSSVLLIGVDLPPNYGGFYRQRLQSTYERVAHKHNVTYRQLTFPSSPALVQPDGIHPSTQGHSLIADTLGPVIEEELCR